MFSLFVDFIISFEIVSCCHNFNESIIFWI